MKSNINTQVRVLRLVQHPRSYWNRPSVLPLVGVKPPQTLKNVMPNKGGGVGGVEVRVPTFNL